MSPLCSYTTGKVCSCLSTQAGRKAESKFLFTPNFFIAVSSVSAVTIAHLPIFPISSTTPAYPVQGGGDTISESGFIAR